MLVNWASDKDDECYCTPLQVLFFDKEFCNAIENNQKKTLSPVYIRCIIVYKKQGEYTHLFQV